MPGQPPVVFKPSPAEQTLGNTLALAIDGVIKTDIEDLVQTSRLGNEMDFRELRPLFEKTILLFQALSTANLDFATETRLQRLANDATGIKNEFDQFKTFPPSQLPNRRARIDQYKRRFEEVYESVAPVLGVSQHANLEQYEARAKASLNLLEEDRGKFDSQKAEMERELKETLLKPRKLLKKSGLQSTRHISGLNRGSTKMEQKFGLSLLCFWQWQPPSSRGGITEGLLHCSKRLLN